MQYDKSIVLSLVGLLKSEVATPKATRNVQNDSSESSQFSSVLMFVSGLASSSQSGFISELKQYWFQLYSRQNNVLDSSGFEHVFCGETRSSGVTGFHNWVQFYLLENSGELSYAGDRGSCQVSHIIW